MTVTKQQQLEWLAKAYKTWPEQGSHSLRLSAFEVGKFAIVNCHLITREEWQQERDKMRSKPEVDNSWHEHGELPPVGCVVDVTGDDVAYGYGESDCEVLAHVEDCAVIRMSFGLGCFVAKVLSPSRTEREMEIDEMMSLVMDGLMSHEMAKELVIKLHDSGYRKVNP